MATRINKEYTLENLTAHSVNVLLVSSAKVNNSPYELKRERICFANSQTGRQLLQESLPEEYAKAVLMVWGDSPTVDEPKGGA